MNRLEAIRQVIGHVPAEAVMFHANGAMSRESYSCSDRPLNLYLVGSMGLAASVATGFAVNRPEKQVAVLDGDGNILMGLGNLALVGARKPANLVHIVLDNGVYGTTGNQPTLSRRVSLADMAGSAGYVTAVQAKSTDEIDLFLPALFQQPGPHFLHILLSPEVPPQMPRLPFTARRNKERFLHSLTPRS